MATFTNQATLSYNGIQLNSNTVTGEIVDILSAVKSATPTTYRIGDTITYVINFFNNGTTDITGVGVTDNLGEYAVGETTAVPLEYVTGSIAYYINGVLQTTPPTVTSTNPLAFSGISVPAQGNSAVVYQSEVTTAANPGVGGTVTNIATITSAAIPAPITATATINANTQANLAINKSVSPTSVSDNDTLTYTFLIQNYGSTPVQATENAVVTDTFNPLLSGVNVYYNGTLWQPNVNYVYDTTTGVFTTSANQISVPAATIVQNTATGEYVVTPGTSTIVVSGTV